MTVLDATLLENEDQIGEQAGEPQEQQADPQAEAEQAESPQAEQTPVEGPPAEPDPVEVPDAVCIATETGYDTITITDGSESHDTEVKLLLERGEDERWRGGFYVFRDYDTAPHDKTWTEEPAKQGEHDGYAKLADAIKYAADRAEHWLDINSADDDSNADTALECIGDWIDKLDESAIDETIFDGAEPNTAPETTDAMAAAIEVSDAGMPTTEAPAMPSGKPPVYAPVLRDGRTLQQVNAELEHEKQKRDLAWQISLNHIALAKAKADVKRFTKLIDTNRVRLEQIVEDGPEQLPLFDRVPNNKIEVLEADDAMQAEQAEPDADIAILCDPLQPAASIEAASTESALIETESHEPQLSQADEQGIVLPPAGDPEAWRQTKITDLPGITPKIVEILEADRIVTIGDWVDWPANHPGLEYTQIKNAAGGLTEKRYEKIMEAITAATAGQG